MICHETRLLSLTSSPGNCQCPDTPAPGRLHHTASPCDVDGAALAAAGHQRIQPTHPDLERFVRELVAHSQKLGQRPAGRALKLLAARACRGASAKVGRRPLADGSTAAAIRTEGQPCSQACSARAEPASKQSTRTVP